MSPKSLLYIFPFIFFLFFEVCRAQKATDSLKHVWENPTVSDIERYKAINQFYRTQTFAQPDSALVVIEYHLNLAEEKNSKRQMAKAFNEKSFAYYLKGDSKKSFEAIHKTIKLYKDLNDQKGLAIVYGNLGNIYGERREYREAVRYFNKTLNISKELGNEPEIARMQYNLGIIYSMLDNYELALSNYKKALTIYDKTGQPHKNGIVLSSIGEVYFKQGKYNDAIIEINKALPILSKNNNQISMGSSYFLIAKCYEKLNENNKALEYVNKSLEIETKINNNSVIIERLTFIAGLTYTKNITLATKKANEVLQLVKEDTEHELKADLYNLLYKCYKEKGQFNTSLQWHEKYSIYNDSLQIEKNKLAIIEEAIQKDFDEKLFENKLENEKTQADLKLSQLKKTFLIIGVSALSLLFVVLYFKNHIKRNRKKRDQLLQELETLKKEANSNLLIDSNKFELSRIKLETSIGRKLNDTDWNVLNTLFDDPVIPNKDIAEKVFKSVEGVSSSLRRMYEYFEIEGSKYKKIALLMDAIKRSNSIN